MMKENNAAKISVIVPVYNVEQYLHQCVDSILSQTYTNLEIILVDDGSPDHCPEICDEYAKTDSRVTVIHKQNGGLSDARNAGLDLCSGDYVGFVDSDDTIAFSMYDDLMKTIRKYDADIAYCGFVRMDESMEHCLDRISYGNERDMSNIELLHQILSREHTNDSVWNKLYNKKIFQTVRFPVGRINEDAAVLCSIIERTHCAACTGTYGYNYRQRQGSIMHSGDAEYHMKMLEMNLSEIKMYIIERLPDLYADYLCYEVYETTLMMSFFTKEHAKDNLNYIRLKHQLWIKMRYCLLNRNCRVKTKVTAILFALGIFEPCQRMLYWIKNIVYRQS